LRTNDIEAAAALVDETVATAVALFGSASVENADEATFESASTSETTMFVVFRTGVPATPAVNGVTTVVSVYVPAVGG